MAYHTPSLKKVKQQGEMPLPSLGPIPLKKCMHNRYMSSCNPASLKKAVEYLAYTYEQQIRQKSVAAAVRACACT